MLLLIRVYSNCIVQVRSCRLSKCEVLYEFHFCFSFLVHCWYLGRIYTWEKLEGINTDLVVLVVDGLLFFTILGTYMTWFFAELGTRHNCCDNLAPFHGQKIVTWCITAKKCVENRGVNSFRSLTCPRSRYCVVALSHCRLSSATQENIAFDKYDLPDLSPSC